MNCSTIIYLLQDKFPHWEWSIPPDSKVGFLSTNHAFKIAAEIKEKHKIDPNTPYPSTNPVEIAGLIANEINEFLSQKSIPSSATTTGPYVNLILNDDVWIEALSHIDYLECTPVLQKDPHVLLIDYFNPNVGKKMHVGHIRSGNLGEALRRIFSLKYSSIISNNHIGDWGIQFAMLIWGMENLTRLNLNFDNINLNSSDIDATINQLYQLYVATNTLFEQDNEVAATCKKIATDLEIEIKGSNQDNNPASILKSKLQKWREIIQVSLNKYQIAIDFLRINHGYHTPTPSLDKIDRVKPWQIGEYGFWEMNNQDSDTDGRYNLVVGESFYIPWSTEFEFWVEKGIAIKEGLSIYIDLEEEKLGRCYLVSSEGYSLYHSRDIIARFVWAGLFGSEIMISCADNRQKHSFQQVFAVIKRILDSGLYESRTFGNNPGLSCDQTQKALQILKKQMAEFVSFGFMTLPEGAMSTRKGKIIAFDELRTSLENKAKQVLEEKSITSITPTLINAVSVASLKWVDLSKDRDQDVVFNLQQFLSFEGNTGIYQLYTVARLNSILSKSELSTTEIKQLPFEIDTLNSVEKEMLQQSFQVPIILEKVIQSRKPHYLCNHLYELASNINTWYATHQVLTESNEIRKNTLLRLVARLRNHLSIHLDLLGIETVDAM